jgi:rubrerythrin
MYSKAGTLRILRNNLKKELTSVLSYVDGLSSINYKNNNKKVDTLARGSLSHAGRLLTHILELSRDKEAKVTKKQRDRFLREETSMKELYKFEAARIENATVKRTLLQLSKEETEHEKIVKSIK